MGRKMRNAPVYFALAQVRFTAILSLDQYVPAIQESLRRTGFPDYQKTFIPAINLNVSGLQGPDVVAAMSPQVRHKFMNGNRTAGFVLDPSFLMFQTTHYETFEPFLATFLRGLDVLHRQAEINLSERIGIRYLDAAIPADGEDVAQYIEPPFMGLVGLMKKRELVHALSETRLKNGSYFMTSRVYVYKHLDSNKNFDVAFPPDLLPDGLQLMERFRKADGTYAILDNDASFDDREQFNLSSIEKHYLHLHDEINHAFNLMVTPHALNTWE